MALVDAADTAGAGEVEAPSGTVVPIAGLALGEFLRTTGLDAEHVLRLAS